MSAARRILALLAAGALAGLSGAERPNPWFDPPDPASYGEGRYVYRRNCAICHGETGRGDGELVQNWAIRPRNFTQAVFKYRSTPYGKLPTKADLERTIRHGVSGTPMPVFSQLRDSEISAVIEYIKTFSPDWKDPANFAAPIKLPDEPAWFSATGERATHAAAGRTRFLAACASCHGGNGDGNGPAAATLRDAFGQPIHPGDLRQPLRSGANADDTWRTIAVGINGTPMIGWNVTFTPDEIWELVASIESIRMPAPEAGSSAVP